MNDRGPSTGPERGDHRLRCVLAPLGGELPVARLGGVQAGFHEILDSLLGAERGASASTVLPNRPRVQVCWVDNWDANAVAFSLDDEPHVGFFGGTATLATAVALAIGRAERFAPGLAGGESVSESFAAVSACFARRWPENADLPVPSAEALFRKPVSHDRWTAASDLVWTAAALLLFHEMAHHRRGHVSLVGTRFGMWGLFEAAGLGEASTVPSAEQARLFQAMEVDADSAAIHEALTLLTSMSTGGPGASSGPGSLTAWESTASQSIHNAIVMLGALFSVFDYEQRGLATFRSRRHPHPAVRLLYATRECVSWAEHNGVSEESVKDAVLQGMEDVEWISGALDWSLTQVLRDHYEAVDKHCRELRATVSEIKST